MLPVFFPFGILLGDVLLLWRKGNLRESIIKFILLLIIGGFSFFRLMTTIPLSGHAIILTYYLLYEIVTNNQKSGLRIISGIVPYIITIYFKFLIWNDPLTFLSGLVFGAAVWSIKRISNND
jgi:hypothetical protein